MSCRTTRRCCAPRPRRCPRTRPSRPSWRRRRRAASPSRSSATGWASTSADNLARLGLARLPLATNANRRRGRWRGHVLSVRPSRLHGVRHLQARAGAGAPGPRPRGRLHRGRHERSLRGLPCRAGACQGLPGALLCETAAWPHRSWSDFPSWPSGSHRPRTRIGPNHQGTWRLGVPVTPRWRPAWQAQGRTRARTCRSRRSSAARRRGVRDATRLRNDRPEAQRRPTCRFDASGQFR